MDIKEVLNLPNGTQVKHDKILFTVTNIHGTVGLHKEGNIDKCVFLTSDFVNAEYELVHKKLNFFEAMKLADEGKTVENSKCPQRQYKKVNDYLISKGNDDYLAVVIYPNEILADWYEVIE